MNKYTEPEMICRRFLAENVVTTSGGETSDYNNPNSVAAVKEQLGGDTVTSYVMTMGE